MLAKIKLNVLQAFCSAFLVFAALGLSASVPKSGDTSEYLRILAGIKNGNVTVKGNMSASTPWVYTSQGLKFEEKLKERKIVINFHYQVPTKILVRSKLPFFS